MKKSISIPNFSDFVPVAQQHWVDGVYPYDHAKCGGCATTHGILGQCSRPRAHKAFIEASKKVTSTMRLSWPTTPEEVAAVTELRERFARLYPKKKKAK